MLIILFVISIFNVFKMLILNVFTTITHSKTIRDSQNLTLMTRNFIDLSFFIIISIIKTIITINNNNSNSSHKLFKNNNVHCLKLVDFYKLSTKTQTSFLNKINLVNKTQTLTIIIITEIRLNLTIINFNDDFLLKYVNIISKIKKTSYREINKSNIMFIKTLFTEMSFNKKRNFIIIFVLTITIVSTKKFKIRIS